ncbi:hypothetical protein [Francisella sp. LA112445]|uniref:TackOD1 domain-containing metal-binding protein n=1 Tax=Francisella sp. LA112445 TaxID=1395624 RepID=UPI001788B7DC|nr:hypothetical protein [Francisella sp. LA112445]QIW10321.1 hypothetical protein FIP56_06275 [Francisella sp. LA112445]
MFEEVCMSLNIAILENSNSELREKLNEFTLREFSKSDDVSRDFEEINAFVIDYDNKSTNLSTFDIIEIVKKIRSSAYSYLTPVFCNSDELTNYTVEKFTDAKGLIESVETINQEIANIEKVIKNINNVANDWQARFLVYLCTRKSARDLTPYKNASKETCYSYPVLDVFVQDDDFDYNEWINELKNLGIIKYKKLKKSFLYCSNCSSSHLLFSKRCPECQSEDIIVGADTKYPDSYTCRMCESIFVKPDFVSECTECGTIVSVEQMRKQNIIEYTLTSNAEHHIKMNLLNYSVPVYDEINYIIPEFFYSFVDWAYTMQNRDPSYEFSLIHINIFDYIGANDIEAISKALRNILRKTDMLTRMSQHDIWLWLPGTSLEGAEVVVKMIKDAHLSERDKIEDLIDIAVFHSKSLEDFSTAEKFLQGLSVKE